MSNKEIISAQGSTAIVDSDYHIGAMMQDANIFCINTVPITITLDVSNQSGITFNVINRAAGAGTVTVVSGANEPFIGDAISQSVVVPVDSDQRFIYDTISRAWRLTHGIARGAGGGGVPVVIDITGDATGSGTTSIPIALSPSGVIAGTYGNSTAIFPVTVDAKGRVTLVGASTTITPGWTSVTGKPTTVAESGITDAATKQFVVDAMAGTNNKGAARAVQTASTLTGLIIVDGVQLVENDTVLVNITNSPLNGIYRAHAGAWVRDVLMDIGSEIPNAYVTVNSGSVYAGSRWTCTTIDPVTIGTTVISWTQLNTGGLTEAPNDAKMYGRKSIGWSRSVDASGDTMTGPLSNTYTNSAAAALSLSNGASNNFSNDAYQMSFAYYGVAGGAGFRHWIRTQHLAGTIGYSHENAIGFYLSNGVVDGDAISSNWGGSINSYGFNAPHGTETNPSFHFGNIQGNGVDAGTGMYRPNTSEIGFTIAGTIAARFNAARELDMLTNPIINVRDPVNAQDAMTLNGFGTAIKGPTNMNPYACQDAYGPIDANALLTPGLFGVNGLTNGPAGRNNVNLFMAVYRAPGSGQVTQQLFNRGNSDDPEMWQRNTSDCNVIANWSRWLQWSSTTLASTKDTSSSIDSKNISAYDQGENEDFAVCAIPIGHPVRFSLAASNGSGSSHVIIGTAIRNSSGTTINLIAQSNIGQKIFYSVFAAKNNGGADVYVGVRMKGGVYDIGVEGWDISGAASTAACFHMIPDAISFGPVAL